MATGQQEGQHPLTGQRAANFRLLANQWAERRLVTQWRHGCRVMRRSVCNAGASNGGRSLCVQISRERSYPLPIYWYHWKKKLKSRNIAISRRWLDLSQWNLASWRSLILLKIPFGKSAPVIALFDWFMRMMSYVHFQKHSLYRMTR